MVGNARGPRPAVAAALDAGIVPDVYGQKWQGLVPAEAWKGTYLPNEKLPDHYRSSGVVLNDHWDEMREWGILSNRLFDLAACGARVISDDIPQISQTFADVVLTFDGADDLPGLVRAHLEETPEVAERRAALSERVRLEHSFAARARTLSDRATAHLAAKGLAR